MSTSVESAALWAQSNWHALGDRFSGKHLTLQTDDVVGLLLALGAFAFGFWLLAWLGKRQESSPNQRSPRRLASELAQAHRLSWGERMTLRRVAGALGLAKAAELFVRPEHRDAVAAADAGLANRLFGPAPDQGVKRW